MSQFDLPVLAGHKIIVDNNSLIAGPGVKIEKHFQSIKSGILKKSNDLLWINFRQRRYFAVKGDDVIGIVQGKTPDAFRVDIGGGEAAVLNVLSFEGATKRSYPDLKVGDVVFGRVIEADNRFENEIVCMDSQGKANGLGPLPTTQPCTLINVSCNYCRRLLCENNHLLSALKEMYTFEMCVGHNGRIYVAAQSQGALLLIVNTILTAEKMNEDQIKQTMAKLQSKQVIDM